MDVEAQVAGLPDGVAGVVQGGLKKGLTMLRLDVDVNAGDIHGSDPPCADYSEDCGKARGG
jgi:hypothetical protein